MSGVLPVNSSQFEERRSSMEAGGGEPTSRVAHVAEASLAAQGACTQDQEEKVRLEERVEAPSESVPMPSEADFQSNPCDDQALLAVADTLYESFPDIPEDLEGIKHWFRENSDKIAKVKSVSLTEKVNPMSLSIVLQSFTSLEELCFINISNQSTVSVNLLKLPNLQTISISNCNFSELRLVDLTKSRPLQLQVGGTSRLPFIRSVFTEKHTYYDQSQGRFREDCPYECSDDLSAYLKNITLV